MPNHIKVLLSFARTTPSDLLLRATAVYAGLNGNAHYTNPPVAMSDLKTSIDGYDSSIVESLDGGKKAFAQRKHQGEVLIKMLRRLAHYVEANCKEDMEIFRSSGFEPAPATRTATPPLSKSIRKITPGSNSGELQVTLVADPEAFSYELRWAPAGAGGIAGAWTSRPVAFTRPATLVENLTPGTAYVFQIRALTHSGCTDWSDSVTCICT